VKLIEKIQLDVLMPLKSMRYGKLLFNKVVRKW
jgi:hypothetical protein